VTTLLDACVADGSVREGLDPDDVLLLMGFLWRVPGDPAGKDQARRMMGIAINGMRPVEIT
jgi:hypothetical protein